MDYPEDLLAPLVSIRGRGAAGNPKNRFEALEAVPDPAERDPDDPGPRTRIYRDTSRTIITRNDSPDVGFEYSINPYRGCEHGCVYCLSGDTRILMGDGSLKELRDVSAGDEIYGTERHGWYRRYVRTTVRDHWRVTKPACRITVEDGTTLVAGGDHRFLTDRGWKFVDRGAGNRPHLTTNNRLMGTGSFTRRVAQGADYRRGYLCGIIRGDGLLASYRYERAGRSHGDQFQFRLALADPEALERVEAYLADEGVAVRRFRFAAARAARREMMAVRTHARLPVERIRSLVAWPADPSQEWEAGFLAGIFDAEGSCSDGVLRISNTDGEIVQRIVSAFHRFGFDVAAERPGRDRARPIEVVRLRGGLRERLRFFHLTDPAISRKRDMAGVALKSDTRLRVVKIERLPFEMPLYDISTGTGDFIAEGVVSHNCYARPTHEYLGWSAGLDFETRILAKMDAPAMLRDALASLKWTPKPLVMSGVTDPYQPLERRLRITRGCLEVLAEFRNPVGIITKNHLVTRDVDVLAELAGHGAARVNLSVTSLDPALQRVMEPRTATPERRLDAIRTLTEAGIPVGVMVAPIIPGLTDHEVPAILEAVAEAGATGAGYVALRLPYAVSGLFEEWLDRHFPERKSRVLNRVKEIRGGKLYDSTFGSRMRGEGIYAQHMKTLFETARRKVGLDSDRTPLSTDAFRRVEERGGQRTLFG
jgi:DNA repair photolyase